MTTKRPHQSPIAVVGVSALFPGSLDSTGFWKDILNGRDLITDVPPTHWLIDDYYDPNPAAPDKTYARRGAFLQNIDFDPVAFGVPPSVVPATDTSQLLALIVAQRVLEDATRGDFSKLDKARTSVILGVTSAQELLASMVSRLQRPIWVKALRESGVPEEEVGPICERIAANYTPWQESSFPGLLGNVVAGRIANRFDLGGTNCVTDAACASTLSAVSMAINELYLGQSDLVIAGGVDTLNDIFMYMCFSKTPALSPSGDCRPFADGADGTMLGEGLGMVALRRLEDAERDGNPIYAVLTGLGSGSDGRAKSVYAPLPAGQARALKRAYDAAGYSPGTVELLEAHGTATKAGDVAEVEGLKLVFKKEANAAQTIALGSVKSQIGHTKSAAGAAGLFKMVMALHHKVLPPTLKVDRPNPKLKLEDSPFYLNTRARPWVRGADHPRRGAVSAFGFGGSNFHVTAEEYTGKHAAKRFLTRSHELFVLSAATQPALASAAKALIAKAKTDNSLPWTARATQQAFDPKAPFRLAVVVGDLEKLSATLTSAADALAAGKAPSGAGVHFGGEQAGPLAFVFPGQGSQAIDMGGELAMHFASAIGVWDRAASLGLHHKVFPLPVFDEAAKEAQVTALRATEWAQPAIGATSASMLAILKTLNIQAQSAAGHSFGELTALYAAQALSEADFLAVARKRGELMAAAAASPGAMTAVVAARDAVEAVLKELESQAVVANHNSPTQVVISGPTAAVEAAEQAFKAKKVRSTRLPVATAFHSPVVADSVKPFADFLSGVTLSVPTFPVFANSTAAPHAKDAAAIKTLVAEQIGKPVRFVEEIEAMHQAGARVFLEVGPGTVLTGLVGRILDGKPHVAISLDDAKNGVAGLFNALGKLIAAGVPMSLEALFDGVALEDPSKKLKPKMALPINGSNYGRPYPPPGGSKALPPPNPPRKLPEPKVIHVPAPAEAAAPVAAVAAVSQPVKAVAPTITFEPSRTDEWLRVFEETQRQTADAHVAFQRSMADSHKLFMETMTSSLGAPVQTAVQVQQARLSAPVEVAASVPVVKPAPAPISVAAPIQVAPVPVAKPVAAPMAVATPVQVAPVPVAKPAARAVAPAGVDVRAILFQVVSDKTGYPVEALGPSMDLEGDLGIDSIKRVEIFSSLREKATGLPELSTEQLGKLRTLEEILTYVGSVSAPVAVAAPVVAAVAAPAGVDVRAILLQVVSDKTGYPVEALGPSMDLEGDLGIDSIKRVEIFSSLREKATGLPELSTEQLGKLRTLEEILTYVGSVAGSAPAPVVAAPVVARAAAPAGVDVRAILFQVVSEKTGYPVEALGPSMDLEGDLGIDSIKRVEIFSSLREKAAGLPELSTEQLGKLRTLEEILTYVGSVSAPVAVAGPVVAAVAAPAGVDVRAILFQVVSEKTGYPVEALGPSMDLEGDLGIDSIKRVEIFSSLREKASGLPELSTEQLGKLRTLDEILTYVGSVSAPVAVAAPVVAAVAAPAGVDVRAILFQVVSEKTGYPVEALGPSMDLEGDLGIDSIKRVEIFSSLREKAAGLPELSTEQLGKLRTLEEILTYVGSVGSAPVAAVAVAAKQLTVADDLGRWAIELAEVPSLGLRSPRWAPGTRVAVTNDGGGLQASVIAQLIAHGLKAEPATEALDAPTVIDLSGLAPEPGATVAFHQAALLRAQRFHKAGTKGRSYVVVVDAGGTLGVGGTDPRRAGLGGVMGLIKTAALEWPDAEVRGVDLARGGRSASVIAEALVQEVLFGGPEVEVALSADGRRTRLVSRRTPTGAGPSAPALDAKSVFVISGGGRGVTRAIAEGLARRYHGRFALLGRTPLVTESASQKSAADERALLSLLSKERPGTPLLELKKAASQLLASREIQGTLTALQSAGATAQYFSTDVRDPASVAKTLTEVRAAMGPISAVIHAAGVIEDRLISDKTAAQADRVLGTKIEGLEALLAATAADPLKVIALFGSISGRTGNIGQSDYAMANETLGKLAYAEAARRPGCVVKLCAWGPWKGGMVTASHEQLFKQRGVPLIDLDSGTTLFLEELEKRDAVEVVLGCSPNAHAPLNVSFVVDAKAFDYLHSHQIKGVPVVPVVLVLEWFVRLARMYQPELRLTRLTNLKVLRGARLDRFEQGQTFTLTCRTVKNGGAEATLALELKGSAGELHYSAEAHLAPSAGLPSLNSVAPQVDAFAGAIYGGVLFHGPGFQAIQAVGGVSDAGATATLKGLKPLGWPVKDWRTDSAVLDGGLQLALLWSQKVLGKASLPTSIRSARVFGVAPLDGDVQTVLRGQTHQHGRASSDVVFLGPDGQVVAELEGVETHALASES